MADQKKSDNGKADDVLQSPPTPAGALAAPPLHPPTVPPPPPGQPRSAPTPSQPVQAQPGQAPVPPSEPREQKFRERDVTIEPATRRILEPETEDYRFEPKAPGATHFHAGRALKAGDVVGLTIAQSEAFKDRFVKVDSKTDDGADQKK
jgi:hypothetical protein